MRRSQLTNSVNMKNNIVKVKMGGNIKARAFLDLGAQIDLIMERHAKLLEETGLYYSPSLTVTMADFSITTFAYYMPQIPVVFEAPSFVGFVDFTRFT